MACDDDCGNSGPDLSPDCDEPAPDTSDDCDLAASDPSSDCDDTGDSGDSDASFNSNRAAPCCDWDIFSHEHLGDHAFNIDLTHGE